MKTCPTNRAKQALQKILADWTCKPPGLHLLVCTVYSVQCIVYSVCTAYSVCIVYTVQYTVYVQCIVYSMQCIVYVQCMYSVHSTGIF